MQLGRRYTQWLAPQAIGLLSNIKSSDLSIVQLRIQYSVFNPVQCRYRPNSRICRNDVLALSRSPLSVDSISTKAASLQPQAIRLHHGTQQIEAMTGKSQSPPVDISARATPSQHFPRTYTPRKSTSPAVGTQSQPRIYGVSSSSQRNFQTSNHDCFVQVFFPTGLLTRPRSSAEGR